MRFCKLQVNNNPSLISSGIKISDNHSPNKEKPFPYLMTFPFNGDSVWIYPFVYFSTAYGGIVAVTTMFSTDSILGFYTTYVCGQLELLHKDISKIIPEGYNHIINSIGSYTNIPSEEKLVQEEYCRRLRLVISRYNVLIKWVLFYIYLTSCIFF